MKSFVGILAAFIALNIAAAMFPRQASAQQTAVNFQIFYDELSPYGQWVDYPGYGYAWIPDAGPDFVPYSTGGYWVLSNDGWTWVSDYDWGWAPFHYGRWDYDNAYGWFWIPDNVWGPSWVTWRQSNGYYGWAPMRPGVSIEFSFGGSYNMPGDRWTFVRDRDFGRRHVDRYRVDHRNDVTIFRNSTVVTRTYVGSNRHTTYVAGPDRNAVQKATGRSIKPVAIQNTSKPGEALDRGQLRMYRPEVRTASSNGQSPVPPRVVNMRDVKPPAERAVLTRPRSVNPPVNNGGKQQPFPPRNTSPAVNRGPQRQAVKPATVSRGKEQLLPPRMATPPLRKANGKQQQTVKPPHKNDNNKNQQTPPPPKHDEE